MAMKLLYLLPSFLLLCGATGTTQGACNQVTTKLQELSTAVQELCDAPFLEWTSVPMTLIGSNTFDSVGTVSFDIPAVIPSSAKQILVFAHFYSGNVGPNAPSFFKIFTEKNGRRFEQYISLHPYPGTNFHNTNSDNLWFPMPPNRRIYLDVPRTYTNWVGGNLYAIGFR